jgi:hypothetical protein
LKVTERRNHTFVPSYAEPRVWCDSCLWKSRF